MANNLTAVTPKLLAMGLMALRQNAIVARLVNRRYEALSGEKGSTIDVPIPSAIAVQNVSPGPTPPSTADVAPTSVPVQLNSWKEAPFYMTDKDVMEAMEGIFPMQASEAVKALANQVDADLLALATSFYSQVGTAGTAFFPTGDNKNDTTNALAVRRLLNNTLAPQTDRHFIMDPTVESEALAQRAYQDMSWNGDMDAIINGRLNQRHGFAWWMDQNVPVNTSGVITGTITPAGTTAIGATSVTIDVGAGESTGLKVGDVIVFSNHSQQYVITGGTAAGVTVTGADATKTITIAPALQAQVVAATTIKLDNLGTAVGSQGTAVNYTLGMAFQRDAIAFATRPLAPTPDGLGVITDYTVDPLSGLTLRLQITHEHKRLRWSWDILYGLAVIRRELGCRTVR